MRLIDADALKEDFKARLEKAKNWKENALNNSDDELVIRATATIDFICEVIMTINNAPTVNLKDIYQEGHYDGHLEGYTKAINEERPQGEWEKPFEMNGKTYHKCNHCHISSELILIDKFCPNCGAAMRKGGTE